MRIKRTLPPAAAPIYLKDILWGFRGVFNRPHYLDRFRRDLCRYFHVKYCFLVSSGKAALTLILTAIKELSPRKNEVLIPAYTCYSVPSAILRAWLKVALCDINPETLDFDYGQLADRITGRTLCIIPCHLFGYASNLEKINALAKARGIYVIEDTSQAMGTEYRGQKVGTLGDVSFFSLGRGKNISAIEGGIILTNNSAIARNLESKVKTLPNYNPIETMALILKALLINVFLQPCLYWFPHGLPFLGLGITEFSTNFKIKKMTGFQGGLARNWKQKLEGFNKTREDNAHYFQSLMDINGTNWVRPYPDTRPVYLRLPIIVRNSDCRKGPYFRKDGLGIKPMYPDSIDSIDQIRDQVHRDTYPEAHKIAQSLLTLPTHSLLSQADKNKIVNLLNKWTKLTG